MANNLRMHLSAHCSLNPENQMPENPLIKNAVTDARNEDIPPKIPLPKPIHPHAPAKTMNSRVVKVEQLCGLRERHGSLKSGEQMMEMYVRMLASEFHKHVVHVGDTCLLLDPLLRTHDSSVLRCFMKHQGLHRLVSLLQRFSEQKFDEGRSVLRKLLKVIQHLEDREMLTMEHTTCHPPRFCMYKFCKVLFRLADSHDDSEVRTLACSLQGLRFSIWIQSHPAHKKCC